MAKNSHGKGSTGVVVERMEKGGRKKTIFSSDYAGKGGKKKKGERRAYVMGGREWCGTQPAEKMFSC